MCPPTIYGVGSGPGHQRSIQLPLLAYETIKRGKGFYVGEGKARWPEVHVHDLSHVLLRVAEEAAKGGGSASWGREGYYFVEAGEFLWSDVSRALAKEGKKQGFLDSDEVDALDTAEVAKIQAYGPVVWGANSRATASRARRDLGWKPTKEGILSSSIMAENIKIEKKRLDKGEVATHAF